jgi:hypothetical protein
MQLLNFARGRFWGVDRPLVMVYDYNRFVANSSVVVFREVREMARDKLKMAHGVPVEGDQFWGREVDLGIFISRIEAGAHQLLIAQRRMGKTSLMKETARRLKGRYLTLFVDLQKCSSAIDVIAELGLAVHPYKPLWGKVRDALGGAIGRVEGLDLGEIGIKLRAGLVGEWRRRGDEFMAVLAASDLPVLLLIDEAPIVVNRILKGPDYNLTPERRHQADLFLSWLRDNSIRHQGRIRIVLSGSIGLEPILRQARLSATLNNFEPFELGPWDEATACGCLEALASEYGLGLDEGVPQRMVKMLGCCIPHHVQMFFRHAHDWCARRGAHAVSARDVKLVYDTEMLSIRGHAELTHYEERLKMVLGDELLPVAEELLTETAVAGRLTAGTAGAICQGYQLCSLDVVEAQRQIIEVLEHDGYLARKGDCYRFVSRLLRDWWRARYEFGYTPVSKRGA